MGMKNGTGSWSAPFLRLTRSSFGGVVVARSFKSVFSFFSESWAELKKVRWPNRKELTNYTLIVIGTILFVAIYFWVLDIGISAVIEAII